MAGTVKVKDRVRVTVTDAGTGRQREIVGTVTASQVSDLPGIGPWGAVVVKELGVNLYHSVDHRAAVKVSKQTR